MEFVCSHGAASHSGLFGIMVRRYALYLFVLGLILSSEPYFFWEMGVGKYGQLLCAVSALLISGLKVNKKDGLSCMLFLLFYLYASLYALDFTLVGRLFIFLPFCIFLTKECDMCKVYLLYMDIFVYTVIPSVIVYLLVVWLGYDLTYSLIKPLNELKVYDYLAYPFCVIPNNYFSQFRFCGCYDEPGVVGTIAGIMLVANRWNLRNWKNIVLLVSGMLSFSLYFYMLQFLYFIFYSKIRYKILIFLVLLSFFYLQNDELVNKFLISRMDFSDGEFSGDNRTGASFDIWYDRFLFAKEFWIGYGKGMAYFVDSGGASYKHLIVDHGFIMFALYIFSFLYLIWCNHSLSKIFFLLLIILFSLIYQRPFVFNYLYLFLLASPIYVLKK